HKAFDAALAPPARTQRWAVRDIKSTKEDVTYRDRRSISFTAGEAFVYVKVPAGGEYMVRYRTFGYQVGPETVKMAVRLDDQDLDRQDVRGTEQTPGSAPGAAQTL